MHARAEENDWFPKRLKELVNFYQSITTRKPDYSGLQTIVPPLKQQENLHLQYLTAITLRDDERISSWFAVDDLKKDLEHWIGLS